MDMQKPNSIMEEIRGTGHSERSMFLDSVSVEIPAERYYHALQGPELEVLKETEEFLLPLDKKWPFLLRFPNACFGMCIGLASQSSLWKALATTPSVAFLHIPPHINLALWSIAVCTLIIVFSIYLLKSWYHWEAVKREFCHPVRVNFFFAPWVACLTLAVAVPPVVAKSVHPSVWCIFMTPLVGLELKVYGQWLFGGERRLSKVGNPCTHLSVVGNFVGSLLAARLGWKEVAKFFWGVGLAHYLVLFVTLYQRLPTSETLPKELHPVFFLFIAAPATASWAWETIFGEFDTVSRISYSVAIFLYASLEARPSIHSPTMRFLRASRQNPNTSTLLNASASASASSARRRESVVRFNFFRGFRFSISWWAYTYPMTSASIATIRYSQQVTHPVTQGMAVLLSVIATTTVSSLFVATLLHAFVWKTLFPNDMAIAITTQQISKHKNYERNLNNKSKGVIRNSLDLMRSTVKSHQSRLLHSKETPVFPDIHQVPPSGQEHQGGDNQACLYSIHSL